MKKVNPYLFLLSLLAFGCAEESGHEAQDLKDGEFIMQLYNSNGDLLLTRKGSAENMGTSGNGWEVRLLDPSFGLQNADPLETFASLTIFGNSAVATQQELQFNADNSASFHQRWYSLEDDWGYTSTSGTLTITSTDKLKINGSFEITLEVDPNDYQNPRWGHQILVKGHFASICPFEGIGGCQ